jgi:NADH-quinone oxidoreductase subunit M
MSQTDFPYLTTLVLLPAIAAVLAALVPASLGERRQRIAVEVIGLAGTVATLAVAIAITIGFHVGNGGYQFSSHHVWASTLGVSWHLGIDGISLFLVLMTAILFPLALLSSRVRHNPRAFVGWILLLEAGCLGSFVSLDLILFFAFFELTLVPVYFVIAGWGFERRSYAAIKFFVYTFLASAFLLVGIVTIAFVHQNQTGVLTFDLVALAHTHLTLGTQILLFSAFTAAFAVKAPIFPFHTWSPDAYSQSPTTGAIILSAVMAKMGTYGILRFDLSLFPRAVVYLAPALLTLGVVGILYGAIVACVQHDLKRLVAYSSLAHIGFIILGTFALTTQGVTGGVLQMVNHGLVTAALFILIGWIYDRRKTWQVLELRGLQRPAPILAACFTLVIMASIGLPGLNGFVGEFLILSGTFIVHRWWAVVATTGVIFAALYLLWAYQQVFHGTPDEDTKHTRDLSWREGVVIAPLVLLIIFLGVYPKPVLDRITPSVNQIVATLDTATGHRQPAVATGTASTASASTPRNLPNISLAASPPAPTSAPNNTPVVASSTGASRATHLTRLP